MGSLALNASVHCLCYRFVSTHQHKVGSNRTSSEMEGAARSLLENFLCLKTACPDASQSHGREAWRWYVSGKSWSYYGEDCSYLEAAAWSQVENFAGLGFEVTLRSIILMRIDKP